MRAKRTVHDAGNTGLSWTVLFWGLFYSAGGMVFRGVHPEVNIFVFEIVDGNHVVQGNFFGAEFGENIRVLCESFFLVIYGASGGVYGGVEDVGFDEVLEHVASEA